MEPEEGTRSSGAGIIGELPDRIMGTEFRSSEEQLVLLKPLGHLPKPQYSYKNL